MNFFISPQFPHTYWSFCDRLHRNGVNVLGIGDSPYDSLEPALKRVLTEYYRVGSYGDGSRLCLAFPPQNGRFYDFENFGMVGYSAPGWTAGK